MAKKSSQGYDEIPIIILKAYFGILSPVKLKICELSLGQGVLPHSLKKSRITLVLKSGDKKQFDNYRPISILCSFGKILEKIVSAQLETHLNENNMLFPDQFGFRR